MARFIRDILATLSHEPAGRGPADQQALSRLDQRLAPFADKGPGSRGTISIQPDECSVWDGNPRDQPGLTADGCRRSEEHTSELQSLMRISYAVFCLKKKKTNKRQRYTRKQYDSIYRETNM